MLIEIVKQIGLDGAAIIIEADQPIGEQLLNEDFQLTRILDARGFPSIIMVNEENKGVKIVGDRPFKNYVNGLKQVLEKATLQSKKQPGLSSFLA